VTEVLRLHRGAVDARKGALRLANLKQRQRALREKLDVPSTLHGHGVPASIQAEQGGAK
jgi:hypothetical protein